MNLFPCIHRHVKWEGGSQMAPDFQMYKSVDKTFNVSSPPMKMILEIQKIVLCQSILGLNLCLIF